MGVMKFFIKKKKIEKKEDGRNKYILMKKRKRIRGVSFVDLRSFKINKKVILFVGS